MFVQENNTEQTFKNNIPFSTKQMTTAFRAIGAISAGIVGFSFGPGAIFMVPFLAATGFVMSETLSTKLAEKLKNKQDNPSKSNKISAVAGAILGLSVALTMPTVGIPVALAAMFGGAYVTQKLHTFTQSNFSQKSAELSKKNVDNNAKNMYKNVLKNKQFDISLVDKVSPDKVKLPKTTKPTTHITR